MKDKSVKPICVIAARGGSKGVPNKNIRKLGDIPLIAHSIKTAISSNLFSSVIVSTENSKIAKISKQYGADVPFLRPKKLATDNASMTDVLLHTITELRKLNYNFDTIVNRDCTVPFIDKKDIQGAIRKYYSKSCNLVCGVYKQHHNPYFNMMEITKGDYMDFSKKLKKQITGRQNSPIVYQLNGLFVLNVENFLKSKKFYSTKIIPYEISAEHGFMIDTEFEFQIADMVTKKRIKLK
jgi:N-acylneuraminate cytidylyltransferase/CMP-N,N'-diacetyllegionaminic acid synthase